MSIAPTHQHFLLPASGRSRSTGVFSCRSPSRDSTPNGAPAERPNSRARDASLPWVPCPLSPDPCSFDDGYTRGVNDFSPTSFFDLDGFEHAALFDLDQPVWHALGSRLDEYFLARARWELETPLPEGCHILDGPVAIGPGCRIEPGVVMRGPLIIGAECEIRTGAYLRGRIVLGRECVVGAHSELKTTILLDRAHAPHQNYVGDSILGAAVNLGAGTILSNVKNIGREVTFRHEGELVRTGLRKLGAILGDGCKTGCNSVLNPGVLMGPGCVVYPNVCLRSGFYPARTLVKLRQVQQLSSLDRLNPE